MSYTVTYDADGGDTTPSGGTYNYDAEVTVGAATAKDGYTFNGWNDGTTTHNPAATFNMPAGNVTLTADWTANTNTPYKVEHYQQNASGVGYTIVSGDTENLTGTTDTTATATANTYTGFTYNAGVSSASGTITGDGNLVLKMYYDRVSSTVSVTYDEDYTGAPAPTTASETVGANYSNIPSPDPTRAGYTFEGWYTEKNGAGTQVTSTTEVTNSSDHTVYADWTANTNTPYKVEHYQQNASGVGYTIVSGDTENLTGTTDTTATATANTYTGFTYNAGASSASGTITGDGNLVLKLYYDRVSYTVTYDADGGDTTPSGGTYNYDAEVTVGAATAKDGYTFNGWNDGTTTHNPAATFNMPAGNVTLTAVWERVPIAEDDTYSTNEDTVLVIPPTGVMSNDTLGDGDNVVSLLTDVSNGVLALNSDGSFIYTPNADFAGDDTFTYRLTDGNGDTSDALVKIRVADMAEDMILTPEEDSIEVGDSLPMVLTFGPTGTDHVEPIIWTSSNPSVATVDSNGVVTGVDVGRVIITAVSGNLSDTSIIEVWSEDPDDLSGHSIRVEGDIFYTTDETPIPDIDMTLFSTPLRGTSNSNGYFYLGYTNAGTHTLTAEVTPGSEIGRIVPVTFELGTEESYVIHSDGSITVTFTTDTDIIYLRLEIPRSTGVLGVRGVNFDSSAAPVINPRTGDVSTWWETILQWIGNIFRK